MKIKKYPQSHLIVEKNGKKLCIDPGDWTFEKGFKVKDFTDVDAILITHRHYDHLPEKHRKEFKQLAKVKPVYGNSEVVKILSELKLDAVEVRNREKFKLFDFEIEPIELSHFKVPPSKETPQNTGFLIDGAFFHAGDGFELQGITVKNAALALGHSSLSMLSVLDFAQQLKVKVLIPIHFDTSYPRDPVELQQTAQYYGYQFKVIPLKVGEETEIN